MNSNAMLCSLCQISFIKNTGISTIIKHFEKNYADAYKQINQEVQNNQLSYTENNLDRVELINLHVYSWIINDQQPFNVVENKEFKSLLFVLDPRFKLPTRQIVSQHIVILHWINEKWFMKNILLDFIPVYKRHTGIAIAEKIYNTLKEYNLESKLLAVTTDNAPNMIVFEQYLKTIQEGIKLINKPIEKTRKFANIPIRWNSLYLSIQKLRRIKNMTDILVT
ncbi:6448_t:CDS:2, partial [Funneliformis geosporum]